MEKLLNKLKKRLEKVELELDKCRTCAMQDGWQTKRFARKSVKWDFYAKEKRSILGKIDDINDIVKKWKKKNKIMKTREIVFNEFNEWVYNDENQAGDKLQVIDASDLPEIITEVVKKLTIHNVIPSLPNGKRVLAALKEFSDSLTDEDRKQMFGNEA